MNKIKFKLKFKLKYYHYLFELVNKRITGVQIDLTYERFLIFFKKRYRTVTIEYEDEENIDTKITPDYTTETNRAATSNVREN